MQFRKQKTLVQVLKYDGYNKTSKQPKMVMIGVIDLATFKFKQRVETPLTEVERMEINQAIEREQLMAVNERAAGAALQALEGLRALSPRTDLSGLVKNDPDAIWTGLLAVEKALKTGGYEKPKRSRGPQAIPDSKTGDLLA